jgi:endonuclease/exonuclease/phosphatase family metal-dependent hydrolase
VWPTLIVSVLALVALAAMIGAADAVPRRAVAVPWHRAWPLLAFGPWLALQLIVFQNVARTAAVTGWSLPAAGFVVTAGNIFGLVGAALLAARAPRGAALVVGAGLVLVSWPTVAEGAVAALLVVTGQTLAAVLLARALSASVPAPPAGAGLDRTAMAYGGGQLLLTLFFFAYNAPHSLALPFTEVMVVPLMALCVALPAALAPAGEKQALPVAVRPLLVAGAVLLLAPVGVALTWQTPRPEAPANPADSLRVLDYNLHNGFDVTGRLDIEALAAVIEESGADVVTLQEVSRGWVVAGSLDMLAWLAHRLDMVVASGPTMSDRQWGNAILSRYPMVAAKASPLPSEGLPLQRGYLQAEVDAGGTSVRVISLHLHHIAGEGEVREVQVDALLRDVDAGSRTIIAGDFNAKPESEEIRMLVDAGLVDLGASLGEEPGYTSPAEAPVQRIDYIFLSPDLAPETFRLLETTASDHLPLLAVVRLPRD